MVTGIARICREEGVEHLLLSKATYELYSKMLTKWHRSRGMRYSMCHGVPLHPVTWLPDAKVVAFGGDDQRVELILAGVRHEQRKYLEGVVESLIDSAWSGMIIGRLPTRQS